MTYAIKSFIASDGERLSQLYDAAEGGFPLFYPTAYIARSIRSSASHETQKVHLEAVKRVCEWETRKNIDLPERFQRRQFLSAAEFDDLARHLQAARRGRPGDTISATKMNTYVAYAAKYLRWLAVEVITDSNTADIQAAIATQHRMLTAKVTHKRGSKAAWDQRILAKKLPDEARAHLLSLFDNPFQFIYRASDRGPRLRNVVMLRILYETGMRRGELLREKLCNIQESGGVGNAYLHIERNYHDGFDTRVHQPVTKTRGRTVPISAEAESQLLEYISEYRAEIRGVGFSDNDFIFVNHRAGRGQGEPLSEFAFYSALANLKEAFPALAQIHPHLLRHDWNYRFLCIAKEEGMTPEKERAAREYLMGWQEGSGMSRIYNRRPFQEKANETGLEFANDTRRVE